MTEPRRAGRRSVGLTALVLGSTAGLIGALWLGAWRLQDRGDALADARARDLVGRAARAADHALRQHLLGLNLRLENLGTILRESAIALDDPERVSRLLIDLIDGDPLLGNLALMQGGLVIAAASPVALQVEAEPDLAHDQVPGLTLSGPLPNPRHGEPTLVIGRSLDVAGYPGLRVVAEVPVSLVAASLDPLITPAGLRIRLEDAGGRVRAASTGQRHLLNQRLGTGIAAGAGNPTIELRTDRQAGGLLYSATLQLGWAGLYTVVTLPTSEALGSWPALRARIHDIWLGFAALILALGLAVLTALRLRGAAADEREAAALRLEAAIAALPDGFILWDAQDRLVTRNARHRALYCLADDAGRSPTFTERVSEAIELGRLSAEGGRDAALARMLREHREFKAFERQLPGGVWVRVAQSPMPDGGIVGIHTDITEPKRVMAELGEARDAAAAAMAARSRLLSHVSHEMRTPLASLLRLTEQLAADAGLGAEQRRRVRMVEAAGRHMLALANEVLDLAALEAGQLHLHVEVVEAAPAFEEAAAMLQPVAEAKGVRIETRIEGLPPAMRADVVRLRQVALNLLANAVKFTPPQGCVRVTVRADAGRLTLDVTDEGPGVSPAQRERLFGEFHKLSPADVEGSGLGLAITARLVGLMGGRIACLDAPAGAHFRVELPLEAAEEVPPAGPPAVIASAGPPALATRRLRILAVDDVASNLAVLRALLSKSGFELECHMSGADALEALVDAACEDRPFDAVLMDVMMPGMDGLETTRRLRALPGPLGRVPVIAVTASAFPEDVAATRAAGMSHHVAKPVERAVLLRALSAAIARPTSEADHLAALRPALLDEVRHRAQQMRQAAPGSHEQVRAVHALVGTVGNLDEVGLVQQARGVLDALRHRAAEAPVLVAEFDAALREAFPEMAA